MDNNDKDQTAEELRKLGRRAFWQAKQLEQAQQQTRKPIKVSLKDLSPGEFGRLVVQAIRRMHEDPDYFRVMCLIMGEHLEVRAGRIFDVAIEEWTDPSALPEEKRFPTHEGRCIDSFNYATDTRTTADMLLFLGYNYDPEEDLD